MMMESSAPVSVSAFLDGSDRNDSALSGFRMGDLEGIVADQFRDLTKLSASGDVSLTASVARTGLTSEAKLGKAKKLKLLKWGTTLGLTLAGAAVGMPWLGAGLGVVGSIITEKITGGAQHKLAAGAAIQSALDTEPTWKGTKSFSADTRGLVETAVRPDMTKMDANRLRDDLVTSRQSNPNGMSVSFVSGHGVAGHLMAGLPLDEVGRAYAEARETTGKQTDLGVYHACSMGNLESLNFLKDHVKVAVVSQDAIDVRSEERTAESIRAGIGGSGSQGLGEALKSSDDTRTVAKNVVSSFVSSGKAQTMTAVDLEVCQKDFMPAFGKLNEQLLLEGMTGKGAAIRQAFEESTMKGNKDQIDLSRFLANLSKSGFSQATQDQLATAQEAADKMILANASVNEGSQSLSLYRTPHFFFDAPESGLKRFFQKAGGLGEMSNLKSSGMPQSWDQVRDIYGKPEPKAK